jgi:hypothetical protein
MALISINNIVLFESSQALPPYPSDNSTIKMKINTDRWWNGTDKKRIIRRKTCPNATLFTINLTRTGLGSNPGLREFYVNSIQKYSSYRTENTLSPTQNQEICAC